MGTIKIILKKDINNLGEEGDIKTVKRGYARNFLFPGGLAVECSKNNLSEIDKMKDYYEKRKLEKKDFAQKIKELLENKKISISVSSGDKGRLFGTVTSTNIAEELNKDTDIKNSGYTIEKKNIELNDHIKFQGNYKYRVHLYQDIYANMELTVIAKVEKPQPKDIKGRKKRFNKNFEEKPENENITEEVNQSEEQVQAEETPNT